MVTKCSSAADGGRGRVSSGSGGSIRRSWKRDDIADKRLFSVPSSAAVTVVAAAAAGVPSKPEFCRGGERERERDARGFTGQPNPAPNSTNGGQS